MSLSFSSCQDLVPCTDRTPEWAGGEREREGGREREGEDVVKFSLHIISTLQVLIMLTLNNNLSFFLHLSLPYSIGQGRNCVPKALGEVIKLKFMINVVFINSVAATQAGNMC